MNFFIPKLDFIPTTLRVEAPSLFGEIPTKDCTENFEKELRGPILAFYVSCEATIDYIFLELFFSQKNNPKRTFFYDNFLFDLMTFENKKKFLVRLAKENKFYNNLLDNQEPKLTVKEFFSKIKYIQDIRNSLAHSMLEFDKNIGLFISVGQGEKREKKVINESFKKEIEETMRYIENSKGLIRHEYQKNALYLAG